jgi:ribosome-associated protein
MERQAVSIRAPGIPLDAFLKFAGAAATGGEAKHLVQGGRVQVNGSREIRRGRQLRGGDVVELLDQRGAIVKTWEVQLQDQGSAGL